MGYEPATLEGEPHVSQS